MVFAVSADRVQPLVNTAGQELVGHHDEAGVDRAGAAQSQWHQRAGAELRGCEF